MGTCFLVDGTIMFSRLTIAELITMLLACHDLDRVTVDHDAKTYTGRSFLWRFAGVVA